MLPPSPPARSFDLSVPPDAAPGHVRFGSLDTARAVMLLLGVPFHASEIYRVSGGWHVVSPDASWSATLLGALVHVFRMPAFFVLGGFFAAMLLERRGDLGWLIERFHRLGVPLACSLLGFGWLESAIALAHRDGIALADAIWQALRAGPAQWSHHRWFLAVLLLHCASAVALRRLLPGGAWPDLLAATRGGPCRVLGFAAFLVLVPFAIAGIGSLAGSGGGGSIATAPHDDFYLRYAAFFALGYGLYRVDGSLDRFVTFHPADRVLAALALPLWLVSYPAFRTEVAAPGDAIVLMRLGTDLVAGLYATKLFLLCAGRLEGASTSAVRYLVDASLCAYLVHFVFVLALGVGFAAVAWPPMLELCADLRGHARAVRGHVRGRAPLPGAVGGAERPTPSAGAGERDAVPVWGVGCAPSPAARRLVPALPVPAPPAAASPATASSAAVPSAIGLRPAGASPAALAAALAARCAKRAGAGPTDRAAAHRREPGGADLASPSIATLAGERLELHPERAVHWPARRTLFVADVHLGKEHVFGRRGIPIPGGISAAQLARLAALVARTAAERLVVLGDLMHDAPTDRARTGRARCPAFSTTTPRSRSRSARATTTVRPPARRSTPG